jgi:hypothetical protein
VLSREREFFHVAAWPVTGDEKTSDLPIDGDNAPFAIMNLCRQQARALGSVVVCRRVISASSPQPVNNGSGRSCHQFTSIFK